MNMMMMTGNTSRGWSNHHELTVQYVGPGGHFLIGLLTADIDRIVSCKQTERNMG